MNFAISREQAQHLASGTIFTAKEIQDLYKRFKELDVMGRNKLEYEVSRSNRVCVLRFACGI